MIVRDRDMWGRDDNTLVLGRLPMTSFPVVHKTYIYTEGPFNRNPGILDTQGSLEPPYPSIDSQPWPVAPGGSELHRVYINTYCLLSFYIVNKFEVVKYNKTREMCFCVLVSFSSCYWYRPTSLLIGHQIELIKGVCSLVDFEIERL